LDTLERASDVAISRNAGLRVSVVIPCFRNAATIRRALESVGTQTRAVNEIIVVNDASPESLEIERVLTGYPDVVYVRNPVNVGPSASRNVGLSKATGDVIAFLDADDEYHPQKIAIQLMMLTPESVVTCRTQRYAVPVPRASLVVYDTPVPSRAVNKIGTRIIRNTLPGAALMAYRELLLRFGGYDETLRGGEDFDLWLRFLHAGIVVTVVELPLYLYYVNDDGLSRNWLSISAWELEVLKRHALRTRHKGVADNWYWATIWTWWLLKHLLRAETVASRELVGQVFENARLLESWPLHRALISFVGKTRLFRLFALARS
jgi:glycosyltransferase involved in cell wall biosynthesis